VGQRRRGIGVPLGTAQEQAGFARISLRTGNDPMPSATHAILPARSPTKTRSWREILLGTYQSISEDRVLAVAAGVTFYGLLAIFPAVGAIVSLYGLVADTANIRSTLDSLATLLPAGAIEIVGDQIERVTAAGGGTLSFSFALGLAIAIWGANAGVKALFDAINVAYGAKEERSFFKLNLVSLTFTAGAIAFALLALAAVVVLPVLLHYVGLDTALEALLRFGRWPLIWLVIAFGLALLYRFGPTDSLDPKWHWITWGSAGASLLWLAASALFSWYAANFGSYNKTYGSLGAAIGFMTWMWISAAVFIMGAELNAEIEKAADEPHAQRPKNTERDSRAA
jgi:membrane protein